MPETKSYECDGPECEVIAKAEKHNRYKPARPAEWLEMTLGQTDGVKPYEVAFCSVQCYRRFAAQTDWNPTAGFAFYGRKAKPPPPPPPPPVPAIGPHSHQKRIAGFDRSSRGRGRCAAPCCAWRFQFMRDYRDSQQAWPGGALIALGNHTEALDAVAECLS